MKTLIELYDVRPLENILATEVFRPERTVFLVPSEIAENQGMQDRVRAYLKGRGIETDLSVVSVDVNSVESVHKALSEVSEKWRDCALSITGGSDTSLFAAGLFAAGANIPVFTWSRTKQRFFNVQNAPFANVDTRFVRFSAADFLRMAGGNARQGRVDNRVLSRYLWLIEPFSQVFLERQRTWVHTTNWMQVAAPSEKGKTPSLHVSAPRVLKVTRERVTPDPETLSALAAIGMITDLSIGEEEISFSFADAQIRTWLRDTGSVLELLVYKACLDSGLFSEVQVSVIADWAPQKEIDGVSNEIDVVACRGIMPLFISCKTGDIKTEALNELAILRDRFGGGMAQALIVTAEPVVNAQRNRAADLSIAVCDREDLKEGALLQRIAEVIKLSF